MYLCYRLTMQKTKHSELSVWNHDVATVIQQQRATGKALWMSRDIQGHPWVG